MLVSQLELFLLSIPIAIINAGLVSCIPDCKCWGLHLMLAATTTVSFSLMSPVLTNSTPRLGPFRGSFWAII